MEDAGASAAPMGPGLVPGLKPDTYLHRWCQPVMPKRYSLNQYVNITVARWLRRCRGNTRGSA